MPDSISQKVMPCKKRSYSSYERAKGAISRINPLRRGHLPNKAYKCEKCGQYHLTKGYVNKEHRKNADHSSEVLNRIKKEEELRRLYGFSDN